MAHMYPPELDETTESAAERRLYVAFRDHLPNSHTVFHSARWLMRDKRRGTSDGESDFIIVDPQHGVLVLEVKGGNISLEEGQWYSNENHIKDPFEQVKVGKYNLITKMEEMSGWSGRRPYVCHAVAFPDVSVRHDLGPHAPPEIILDAAAISDLKAWVEQVFRYHQGETFSYPALSGGNVKMIAELLAPSRHLTLTMGEQVLLEQQKIIQLTKQQYEVLNVLHCVRRVAISGAAGTGKTVLARERARRLGEEGFRVLLTCYNGYMAGYLRGHNDLGQGDQLGVSRIMPNVTVLNFHKVCQKMAHKAGMSACKPRSTRSDEWYGKELPRILLDAAGQLGPQYDAIVVDEGQDFREDYWDPLQMLLEDPDEGVFYVFYDDNQNLYRTSLHIPKGLTPSVLTHNCRNTKLIHYSFLPFYQSQEGLPPVALGPEGRPVEVDYYRLQHDLRKKLRTILHRLTAGEGIPTQDIVILCSHRHGGMVEDLPQLGNIQLTDQRPVESGEVYCTTINSFKGLESPVVILQLWPSQHLDPERLLYVGCSRACNHLVILAHEGLPEHVRKALPGPGYQANAM